MPGGYQLLLDLFKGIDVAVRVHKPGREFVKAHSESTR